MAKASFTSARREADRVVVAGVRQRTMIDPSPQLLYTHTSAPVRKVAVSERRSP